MKINISMNTLSTNMEVATRKYKIYKTPEERLEAIRLSKAKWRDNNRKRIKELNEKNKNRIKRRQKNISGLWNRWKEGEVVVKSEDGYFYDVEGNKFILSPQPIKKVI